MRNSLKLLSFALLLTPWICGAGEYRAVATGTPGSATTLNVMFAGDGVTVETEATLNFDGALLSASSPGASNGAICLLVSPTRLRIIPPSGGTTPLPATPTTYCSYSIAIGAGAAQGLIPFTGTTIECYDANAEQLACSLAQGAGIDVNGPALPRTLNYAPAVGSMLAFAPGTVAGTQAPPKTIAVAANGGTGVASLSGCAISGSGAAQFAVTPAALTFNTSATQTLSVGCTYSNMLATADLTCTEIDGDTPSPGLSRTFPLNCPAAAPIPDIAPTITSSPVSGSTIETYTSTVGALGTGGIGLIASGGSGNGAAQVTCSATGLVQLAVSPATPSGQGPLNLSITQANQFTVLRVGVILATANQPPPPAGSVTCTISGQSALSFTVNTPRVIGPIISPPPPGGGSPGGGFNPPPQFIPTLSPTTLAVLAMLLAIGGLLLVNRRPWGAS